MIGLPAASSKTRRSWRLKTLPLIFERGLQLQQSTGEIEFLILDEATELSSGLIDHRHRGAAEVVVNGGGSGGGGRCGAKFVED